MPPEAQCDVCFNNFQVEKFRVLHCGHCFCTDCTVLLKRSNASFCPHCRGPIVAYSTHGRPADGQPLFINMVDPELSAEACVAALKGVQRIRDALEGLLSEGQMEGASGKRKEVQTMLEQLEDQCRPQKIISDMMTIFKDSILVLVTHAEGIEDSLATVKTDLADLTVQVEEEDILLGTIRSLEDRVRTTEDQAMEAEGAREAAAEQLQSLVKTVRNSKRHVEELETALGITKAEQEQERSQHSSISMSLQAQLDNLEIEIACAADEAVQWKDRASALDANLAAAKIAKETEEADVSLLAKTVESLQMEIQTLKNKVVTIEADRDLVSNQLEERDETIRLLRDTVKSLETKLVAEEKGRVAEQEYSRTRTAMIDLLGERVESLEEELATAHHNNLPGVPRPDILKLLQGRVKTRIAQLEAAEAVQIPEVQPTRTRRATIGTSMARETDWKSLESGGSSVFVPTEPEMREALVEDLEEDIFTEELLIDATRREETTAHPPEDEVPKVEQAHDKEQDCTEPSTSGNHNMKNRRSGNEKHVLHYTPSSPVNCLSENEVSDDLEADRQRLQQEVSAATDEVKRLADENLNLRQENLNLRERLLNVTGLAERATEQNETNLRKRRTLAGSDELVTTKSPPSFSTAFSGSLASWNQTGTSNIVVYTLIFLLYLLVLILYKH